MPWLVTIVDAAARGEALIAVLDALDDLDYPHGWTLMWRLSLGTHEVLGSAGGYATWHRVAVLQETAAARKDHRLAMSGVAVIGAVAGGNLDGARELPGPPGLPAAAGSAAVGRGVDDAAEHPDIRGGNGSG